VIVEATQNGIFIEMSAYLTVERIEFVVTNRCNSNCRHCLIDNNKRKSKPAAVDIELATKIIKEVTGRSNR